MNTNNTNKINSHEVTQGFIRIGITTLAGATTFLFLLQGRMNPLVPFFLVVFLLFAILYLYYVYKKPGDYPLRRTFIAGLDFSLTSFCFYYGDDVSVIYSFLYIWITVGNGIRFGSRGLIESIIFSFITFTVVVINSDFWQANIELSIGLYLINTIVPLYVLRLTNTLSDLTMKLEMKLVDVSHSAKHDELSGLYNRATFFTHLDDLIRTCDYIHDSLMVVYIDLDGFKLINDQLGHKYGDLVIQRIAERLKEHVRSSDIVCRLGGDEFAIILSGASKEFDVNKYCKGIINKVSEPMTVEGSILHVTASIGVSRFPDNGETSEILTDCADKAMYSSKSTGKNKFTICFSKINPEFAA